LRVSKLSSLAPLQFCWVQLGEGRQTGGSETLPYEKIRTHIP
jgi:hypothetical protein